MRKTGEGKGVALPLKKREYLRTQEQVILGQNKAHFISPAHS